MVKPCPECGTPNKNSAPRCTGCGTSIPTSAISPSRAPQLYRRTIGPRTSRGSGYRSSYYLPSRPNLFKILTVVFLAGLIFSSFAWIITYAQRPPIITHVPVESVFAETSIDINATVLGGLGTENVTLFYKTTKTNYWKNLPMELDQGTQPYSATIPASDVDSSITYQMEAIGILGYKTFSETYIILVKDFNFSLSESKITLIQGEAGSISVNVQSYANFDSSVSLSLTGIPSGVSHSFSQSSVTPPKNGSTSSTLTISTSTTANPGTYELTIAGTSGDLSRTQTLSLEINHIPDFSISAATTSQTIRRGESAVYNMTVVPLYGFQDYVSFNVSGLPSKTKFVLIALDNKTNFGGTQEFVLQITTTHISSLGTFTLTVTATGGDKTHTLDLALRVRLSIT